MKPSSNEPTAAVATSQNGKDANVNDFVSKLLEMINTQVSLDPDVEVLADTDLLMTGLVDSLGILSVVAWIEDAASVEIDPADIVVEHFQTVTRMVDFVGTIST